MRKTPPPKPIRPIHLPKKRVNRRRRDWNKIVRRICGVAALTELGILLFANPHLNVTRVRINGLQTLPAPQVFAEARVPARTNIFWMAFHQPFAARLSHDPVIDHVTRTISLPHTLVLNVAERQPFATLAVAGAEGGQDFWLLDRKGVPFRHLDVPAPGVPLLDWQNPSPPALALGRPLADDRVADAFALMALVRDKNILNVRKIKVDQNRNLCLNREDNLQIKLGQPDDLPMKIAQAEAAVSWHDGAFARRAACIDVSSPQQPVYTLRADTGRHDGEDAAPPDDGTRTESDSSPSTHGH